MTRLVNTKLIKKQTCQEGREWLPSKPSKCAVFMGDILQGAYLIQEADTYYPRINWWVANRCPCSMMTLQRPAIMRRIEATTEVKVGEKGNHGRRTKARIPLVTLGDLATKWDSALPGCTAQSFPPQNVSSAIDADLNMTFGNIWQSIREKT